MRRSYLLWSVMMMIPACGRPEPAPEVAAVVVAAAPVKASEGVIAPVPARAATAAEAVEGPIGVAVCDAFVATYRRCVDTSIPEDERAAHREALAEQRLAWARAKADPELARGLADACAAARLAARASLPRCKGW